MPITGKAHLVGQDAEAIRPAHSEAVRSICFLEQNKLRIDKNETCILYKYMIKSNYKYVLLDWIVT